MVVVGTFELHTVSRLGIEQRIQYIVKSLHYLVIELTVIVHYSLVNGKRLWRQILTDSPETVYHRLYKHTVIDMRAVLHICVTIQKQLQNRLVPPLGIMLEHMWHGSLHLVRSGLVVYDTYHPAAIGIDDLIHAVDGLSAVS